MRTLSCTSMMFVLTDGLYQASERPRIIGCINNCVQSGMVTIGIGMGFYPKGIEKIFPRYVFAGDPLNIMKGVYNLFTDSVFDYSEEMFCISSAFNSTGIDEAFNEIHKKSDQLLFQSLCDKILKITPTLEAFDDFINLESDDLRKGSAKGRANPQGQDTELYVENFLKTHQILIVQFCDDSICGDSQLNKKYIFENSISGRTECVNEAAKFFGISIKIVQNYEDAILEITKSNNNCCDYYAVWVICGSHPEKLPIGQRSSNKYIVEQFIDVLILFWKNGGSLLFWADNDPYTFHVNAFLSKVRFENEESCPSGKVDFQIHGNHPGGEILIGDDSGKLNHVKLFDRSQQLFEELERTKISNNLAQICEGKTISYVVGINDNKDSNYKSKLSFFKAFAIDSKGGVTSMFYTANTKTGTGDIIIDGGFSKLFYELKEEGTYRYINFIHNINNLY